MAALRSPSSRFASGPTYCLVRHTHLVVLTGCAATDLQQETLLYYARETNILRAPVTDDVEGMAKVESWQETHHDSLPHGVLYAPDFLERRMQLSSSLFAEGNQEKNKVAVAELDDQIVGISIAGPANDCWPCER